MLTSAELWMMHLPLGHELDLQHTRTAWTLFWQTADGASTQLGGLR
jgi:hypothetical protein